MALTKNETKMVRVAEHNRETAKQLLDGCFNAYGTDFCVRSADYAFNFCHELFAQDPPPDAEDTMETVIMLLGAAAVVELFAEFRARGNHDES